MNLKNPGTGGETGLPDYVRDHFDYLIRGSWADRAGQAIFFGSSLSLPVIVGICLLIWEGDVFSASTAILIGTGVVFFLSLFWYFWWMARRVDKFRRERPASYARWYGRSRTRSKVSVSTQFKLAKMQIRYVFLGKEPTPEDTLALSMQLTRRTT